MAGGALAAGLAGYARRLHATAGTGHHVASPLGAWLLLALCGRAARGADRAALADVLGMDVDAAAGLAGELLGRPQPQVAAAAAAWTRNGAPGTSEFARWRDGLPGSVRTGALPDQAGLDAWARDNSFKIIESFPLRIDPAVRLVLATALATRVSWEVPFDLAPAAELGAGSRWAAGLGQVLRTPATGRAGHAHRQFIAVTERAGDVAVHLASARGGLLVASVAAAAEVPGAEVLAAASEIGQAAALEERIERRALADLPLGDAPLWTVREEEVGDGAGTDLFTAVLPAWTARTALRLTDPELGFGLGAGALAGPDPWQAAQAATARYSRTGFEAAAVTAMMSAMSMPVRRPGLRRAAELRFAHPYAVVAVAMDPEPRRRGQRPGPWHGVPVFSAWVAEPQDAGETA